MPLRRNASFSSKIIPRGCTGRFIAAWNACFLFLNTHRYKGFEFFLLPSSSENSEIFPLPSSMYDARWSRKFTIHSFPVLRKTFCQKIIPKGSCAFWNMMETNLFSWSQFARLHLCCHIIRSQDILEMERDSRQESGSQEDNGTAIFRDHLA